MPRAWIEKITDAEVKMWAYGLYEQRAVLFTGNRKKDGYPVIAEIDLNNHDIARFSPVLDKGTTIIIYHRNVIYTRIDDESVTYRLDDLIFELECRE